MSTGVDIPCVRFISFAALTKSVGKYIQMIGRGTRLDPHKSGKFSFRVLDFVGLCKKMEDNGKGTKKRNTKIYTGKEGGGGGGYDPNGEYFIIDNPDPENMIERVFIHGDNIKIIDNIPIDKAREIFEEEMRKANDEIIKEIQLKVQSNNNYAPTEDELEKLDEFIKNPNIYLDEGNLKKMYDYPEGSNWDFMLHVLGIKKIPTPKERIEKGYLDYISTYNFSDSEIKVLKRLKDIFASNVQSHSKIDIGTIFANPIYERILGRKSEVEKVFGGRFNQIINDLTNNLRITVS
ncbi:MAG TPA: type I restriction-modification enzyme R subunit C-terminal domain-containing protein [Candidatus Kapabacteria bacterium]|nr:type I restriction-modification enzyme R subunit C-terminal domain-containing protein [Candidatus Kapabacteria bacterium]